MDESVHASLMRAGPPSARAEYYADDSDDASIETAIAARIARLLPKLARAECASAAAHIRAGLLTRLRKEVERVQGIMEELVRPAPYPPRDRPPGAAEASQLLLPVLTDADLLLMLTAPPSTPGAKSHATGPITEALLAHDSPCVREAMLNALVAARSNEGLGAPALSSEAGRALREIAAGHALVGLSADADVPVQQWSEMLSRINPDHSDPEGKQTVANVRALQTSDRLTEAMLLEAARLGQHRRVAAILGIASGVPVGGVSRACGLRNAKALVALAWRSRFTMRSAMVAQTMLGQLSPSQLLFPNADGSFPLARVEMEWQIELLCAPGQADT